MGLKAVSVRDVWQHASLVDCKATKRAQYIDAGMGHVKWDIVTKR